MSDVRNDFLAAEVPPVSDCQHLVELGVEAPGEYFLDFTGDRDIKKAVRVWCEADGWMRIGMRGQFASTGSDVRKSTKTA